MEPRWRIELFGGLRAVRGETVVTRFRTQNSALLLAHLALSGAGGRQRQRPLLRDELANKLWPESEPQAGRTSLRHALMLLRQVLEPEGVPPGAVLVADRMTVGLNPDAVTTDVAEFEAALQAADQAPNKKERTRCLAQAVDLYQGELLAGYYEPWVLEEQGWLIERYFGALAQLLALLEQAGELGAAVEYARRGVHADPLREEAHRDLMRLLAAVGQPAAALRQYEELERLLDRDLGEAPSDELRALAASLRAQPAHVPTSDGAEPPPPVIASTPVGNLPLPLDRFFGRRAEMARLIRLLHPPAAEATGDEELLDDHTATRLVTLTGPGGSGKTRLALEVARRLRQRWQGAIWFVALADLSDARLIPDKLLDALRLPHSATADPIEQVSRFFSRQPSLLVLDNLEHLLPEGALVVRQLLERTATLVALVTSRQSLLLPGEALAPVAPLPVPVMKGEYGRGSAAWGVPPAPSTLPQAALDTPRSPLTLVPSVSLFVDRARLVRPEFALTAENTDAVSELCHRLEGLPLALELAAARVSVLTPQAMLDRLGARFDLLQDGRHPGVPRRHHSLRAALDWSFRLLTPELQRLFARLSVFRGGCTEAAVTAVCETEWTLESLESLQSHSLIFAEPMGETVRFRLLETLREFGAAQLSPDEREALARRHAHYFLSLAEDAAPHLVAGPRQMEWLQRLESEHDNLRAALDWIEAAQTGEIGVRLGAALWRYWKHRGELREGRDRLQRLLALPVGRSATVALAEALRGAGKIADDVGDVPAARRLIEKSLSIARAVGDPRGLAQSLNQIGDLEMDRGEPDTARVYYEDALALFNSLSDQQGISETLCNLADVALRQARSDTAEALLTKAGEICREMNDRLRLAGILDTLCHVAVDQGNIDRARARAEEGLFFQRELGVKFPLAAALNSVSLTARIQGDLPAAQSAAEEALEICRQIESPQGIGWALSNLADAAYSRTEFDRAKELYTESLAIARKLDNIRGIAGLTLTLGRTELRRGQLAAAEILLAEALELVRKLGAQRSVALSLEGLAGVAIGRGQLEEAARLLGAAAAVRDGLPGRGFACDREEGEALAAELRATLGEAAFVSLWDAGRARGEPEAPGAVTRRPGETQDASLSSER